ncbi:MAG: UvrD-helicase domain-containing protein [Patulibacter minatonensis]
MRTATDVPAASPEQQAVRDRAGHPTVLVAAAGSGKTRVLTWLYTDAHLAEGLPIERLLAITFTNRAAGELRERIAHELRGTALGRDPDLTEAWIGTFHGVCARLLREFAHHRGIDPGFAVIDELTAAELKAAAWEDALGEILSARGHDGADLVAQVGEGALRTAVLGWWEAQRSAGEVHPALPTPTTGDEDVRAAARTLRRACEELSAAVEEIRNPGRPSKRLTETLESVEQTLRDADAIEALVDRPPVQSRAAARITTALELPKVPGGPPLGTEHPARLAYLDARTELARRLGELVAGPRVATVSELVRAFSVAYEARKRADECLDHDDLELEALRLLREQPSVRERLAQRFARIFVDEFQDTNPRQAQLVELLSGSGPWLQAAPGDGAPAVTVVGDPRQAIYGFRHATVELILGAARDAPPGVALELSTNYRSDAEVLGAIDRAWAGLDPGHRPVVAHRGPDALPGGAPRVEVLVTKEDRDEPWEGEALGGRPGEESGGVLAEARLVAARIAEVRAAEPGRSVAVLARARRSLVPVAEALAVLGIESVLDGAAGFWGRLEVADLINWLRLVRNPRDDAALVAVLASPLVALSADGLALVGDLPRQPASGGRDARLDDLLAATADGRLGDDDTRRVEAFAALLDGQRLPGRSEDPTALLDEIIAATGYDEHLAALQGGARRLANLARLRRLAAAEVAAGGDLTALVDRAASEQRHGLRAPEAALGGTGAVQLMTVHQAKGLEFDTVVVTGLGAQRPAGTPALLGDEKRLGLRLRAAPGAKALPLFDHVALAEELKARERAELRRVLYVALTRAKERLVVSGIGAWTQKDGSPFGRDERDSAPVIEWLFEALVPEIEALVPAAIQAPVRSPGGVLVSVSTPGGTILPPELRNPRPAELPEHRPSPARTSAAEAGGLRRLATPPVLSYTSISRHAACGLRFYAEDVLRLAAPRTSPMPVAGSSASTSVAAAGRSATTGGRRRRGEPGPDQMSLFGGGGLFAADEPPIVAPSPVPGLPANEIGTLVHAVLELAPQTLDAEGVRAAVAAAVDAAQLRRAPEPHDLERMAALVRVALDAPVWGELWALAAPVRERAFTIGIGAEGHVLTGVVDAQASRPGGEVLVVDYKTDRLEAGVDLAAHVAERYALQRAAYALAALRAGAGRVRVVHLFLDGGAGRQAELIATADDAAALEAALLAAIRVVASGETGVTPSPDAFLCDGCPARGTLCRWAAAATLRAPGSGPADPALWSGDPAVVRAG